MVILKSEQDLNKIVLKRLLQSNSPLLIEKFLPGIEVTVAILQNKPLPVLEIALERKAVEKTLRLTRLGVLSFATAVGFVFLKNVEVSNLRKIAYANAFGLKQELGEYIFAINA